MAHGWSGCEICGGACAWEREPEMEEECPHPDWAVVHKYGGSACKLCDTVLTEPDGGE